MYYNRNIRIVQCRYYVLTNSESDLIGKLVFNCFINLKEQEMNQSIGNNIVSSTEPVYSLGTASRLSNISVHSIRQYIDNGLIIAHTTASKRHLFSQVDILRLKSIKKQLVKMGLNIAGIKAMYSIIPCWSIRPCSVETREKCEAYYSVSAPCWEASNKGKECKNEDCRYCNVYKYPEECPDIKSLIKKITVS